MSQTDRVETRKASKADYSENGNSMECPYCGKPMEEGLFEVPAHQILRPRWIGSSEAEAIVGYGTSFYEFEGFRCSGCHCMLVYY